MRKIIKKMKIKPKKNEILAKVKLTSDVAINEKQYDTLSRNCTYGFFKLSKIDGYKLVYEISGGIGLYERLKKYA